MICESGSSQFYTKYNIIPMSDNGGNDELRDDGPVETTRIKKLMSPLGDGSTRFPKLEDCAHFHYELVELGKIEVALVDTNSDANNIFINVQSGDHQWTIHRTYKSMYKMDVQLHRCIFDRRFSLLPELTKDLVKEKETGDVVAILSAYLNGFSFLANNTINCGPVLSWFEMDNHGSRLVGSDSDAAINTPAVGGAMAIKGYKAQKHDELSFEVGDMLSIIDKPPPTESTWWRGKRNFEVGFFPCEYVELICDNKISDKLASKLAVKPVLQRNTKFISELRAFFSSRPALAELQRTGIVKQRVFGCDLGEHLLNSGRDVPLVLTSCAAVIESHGMMDGIYRLSGVVSNIQKLRNEFDLDRAPCLTDQAYLEDIHSISSLLKMYFRELPNPLFTYQLYNQFVDAEVSSRDDDFESKLETMRSIIQQLPPPHYRTAEFLLRHLAYVSARTQETSMTSKNLSIVWAPNLLRSKDLDKLQYDAAQLKGVEIQAIIVEFLITNVADIFDKSGRVPSSDKPARDLQARARTSAVPASKLISLEDARNRAISNDALSRAKFIEVGAGSAALPQFHTVIDFPRRGRRSVGGWRSIFSRTRSASQKDEEVQDPPITRAPNSDNKEKVNDNTAGVSTTVSLGAISRSTELLAAAVSSEQTPDNDDAFIDDKHSSNQGNIPNDSGMLSTSDIRSNETQQLQQTPVSSSMSDITSSYPGTKDPINLSDKDSYKSDSARTLQISTLSGQYIGERILAPAVQPRISQFSAQTLPNTSNSTDQSGSAPPQPRVRSTFQPEFSNPLPRVHPTVQLASSLPPINFSQSVTRSEEKEEDERYRSFLAWNSPHNDNLVEDFKNTIDRRLGNQIASSFEESTSKIVKVDEINKDCTSPTNENRVTYRLIRRSHDYDNIDETKMIQTVSSPARVSLSKSGDLKVESSSQKSATGRNSGSSRNSALKPLSTDTILSWTEKIVPEISFQVVGDADNTMRSYSDLPSSKRPGSASEVNSSLRASTVDRPGSVV